MNHPHWRAVGVERRGSLDLDLTSPSTTGAAIRLKMAAEPTAKSSNPVSLCKDVYIEPIVDFKVCLGSLPICGSHQVAFASRSCGSTPQFKTLVVVVLFSLFSNLVWVDLIEL